MVTIHSKYLHPSSLRAVLSVLSSRYSSSRYYHGRHYKRSNRRREGERGTLSIDRQITKAQKTKNLSEAMSLFEELISSGTTPTETVLSAMLHLCQVSNDKEKGEEVMKSVDRHAINPGISLLTSKLNYYYWIEDYENVWKIYKEINSRDLPLRQNISFKLLQLALENNHHTQVTDILNNIKKRGIHLEHSMSQTIMELAINEGASSPWQHLAREVMEIYHKTCQSIERETANVITKWIINQWGQSSTVQSTTIQKGVCSHCGNKMESNLLTVLEHSQLLENARRSLVDQAKSFEVSHREEEEYKRLMNLCSHTGQYGAVLDGLNVAGEYRNTKRLIAVAEWSVRHTWQPALVVARVHLSRKFKPNRQISELTHYYRQEKNIDLFFTRNRVADDYYTIYSSLASGPDTYIVSNDKMGDHLSRMDTSLQPIYSKWLRSCRINFSDDPEEAIVGSLILPKRYDSRVQWTETHYHIPLTRTEESQWTGEEEQWLCIEKP